MPIEPLGLLGNRRIRIVISALLFLSLWVAQEGRWSEFLAILVPVLVQILLSNISFEAERQRKTADAVATAVETTIMQFASQEEAPGSYVSSRTGDSNELTTHDWMLRRGIINQRQYNYLHNKN